MSGNISDGYHTFDELYYHRMILFSVICNQNKKLAWKSWLHDDGTMFDVDELPKSPKWDGHKHEYVTRLLKLVNVS